MEHPMSRDDVILKLLFEEGQWAKFPWTYLNFLTKEEALFFSFLHNISTHPKAKKRKGWFFCSIRYAERITKCNRMQQWRLLKSFKDKGLIRIVRKGFRARRWIKIDGRALLEMIVSSKEKENRLK